MTLSPLPIKATINEYEAQARALLTAFEAGDAGARHQLHQGHPGWWRLPPQEFAQKQVGYAEAARTVAWYYAFDSWEGLAAWVTALTQQDAVVIAFEQAADAVVAGDTETLQALLQANPDLIQVRSMRDHHAQLLHYVGANGVEDHRQRSPRNSVEVAKLLLAAGAEVDAMADMYAGSTTLGLVATSIHPAAAGVLIPLLDTLIAAGATLDHPQASGNGQGVVLGCLHNGRPEAARYLASRGATLDLEAAAGVGQLERVQTFFDAEGQLTAGATRRQLELGFAWACAYDHAPVVEFLLDRGADAEVYTHGLAALHWAIINNHMEVIALLLSRGASLTARNHYGGNAVGCALWALGNANQGYHWPPKPIDHAAAIEFLLQQGAPVDKGTLPWVLQESGFAPATIDRLDQLFRQYGAAN